MNSYSHSTIGKVCDIIKGETGLASASPGKYPLVTTGLERKTCNTFQFNTEAVCIPLVSSTGHGKKTLNYVHYQKGKFALGTILAAVIPKEPTRLSAAFLHRYLQFYKDTKIVPLMKGAANVSLAVKDIAKIEIPIPPIDKQNSFIELFNKIDDSSTRLKSEFSNQASCLSFLRQAILQEAVEGKLTAEWRKAHPDFVSGENHAACLLEKIKAEKERLVKEGKIKKQKPLPQITDEEKPFDLPKGWVWCRLGEIFNFIDYRGKTPVKTEKGVRIITAKNIKKGYIDENPVEYISEEMYNKWMTRGFPKNGDILIVTEGHTMGFAAIVDKPYIFSLAQRTIDLQAYFDKYNIMSLYSLLSPYFQKIFKKSATGAAATGIKSSNLKILLIPFPPLKEQDAIVKRVKCLLAKVDELEKQVIKRKDNAEQLMQAVLREAFES